MSLNNRQDMAKAKWVSVNSSNLQLVKRTLLYDVFLCLICSGRLLQPDQYAVRYDNRVLHGGDVRRDVSRAQVRIPLGRRAHGQEAHQVLGAQIHWLPHDLGAGSARWRNPLPLQNWYVPSWVNMTILCSAIPHSFTHPQIICLPPISSPVCC